MNFMSFNPDLGPLYEHVGLILVNSDDILPTDYLRLSHFIKCLANLRARARRE